MKNHKNELSMIKEASRAVLVCGIILMVFGVNAHDSYISNVSQFFTGTAADKSMWMLVGGAVAVFLGIAGLLHRQKAV
ncbi:MAG: DUF3185 family protein [Bacteroidetes bacterium]|nr:DUF3185 family protein [Bacteroidota bacterium]